jgi:hypothetical protein
VTRDGRRADSCLGPLGATGTGMKFGCSNLHDLTEENEALLIETCWNCEPVTASFVNLHNTLPPWLLVSAG